MNILLTGGTGLIGSEFISQYRNQHTFTVVSRDTSKAKAKLGEDIAVINAVSKIEDISAFDAVINLAGEPIADKRWTDTQKKVICESRWSITSQLVAKINDAKQPPKIFISGSAIGFYGNQNDKVVTEDSIPHDEFTHQLCNKWESIAQGAMSESTRVVLLRTGVVLSRNGGALSKMALPFKLGVGGKLGSGDQYLSWIHLKDMIRAIAFLLENKNCSGPFNVTAPEPVSNITFSKQLAASLHRPCLFTVPAFIMKIAMGESSTMILEGQRVTPQNLTNAGFTFEYPTLEMALNDINR